MSVHMVATLRRGVAAGMLLALCCGLAGAQPESETPRSIGEAYRRAEGFGESPGPTAPPAATEPKRPVASPWYDPVHYIGVAGGVVGLLGLLAGSYIFFSLARHKGSGQRARRKLVRQWHMSLGLAAGALALAHSVLRYVQQGEFRPELSAAFLALVAFLVLVASGILRAWPPRRLTRRWRWFMWTHRVALVAMLVFLVWHGVEEWLIFGR